MKKLITLTIAAVILLLMPLFAHAQDEGQPAPAPASATTSPADAYTIFYSPPERLDALFDAMVDAIPYASFDEYAAKNPDATLQEFSEAQRPLPDLAALKALQPRFADMPEYWHMMWAVSGEGTRDVYLEKAYRLFPHDPATVYLYVKWCALPRLDRTTTSEKTAIENYRLSREYAALIAQAAEMDGRNSFYWYVAAHSISKCSGLEEMFALIRRGNECPVNEYVEPFPYSYIQRHHAELPARYPEKYLLLQPYYFSEMLTDMISYRDMMKDVITGVNLSGDLEWLTDAHRFACRFAMLHNAPTLITLSGSSFVSTLSSGAIDMGYEPEGQAEVKGFALYQSNRGMIRGMNTAGFRISRYRSEAVVGADMFGLNEMKVGDPRCKEFLRLSWEDDTADIQILFPLVENNLMRLYTFDFADPGAYTGRPATTLNPVPDTITK